MGVKPGASDRSDRRGGERNGKRGLQLCSRCKVEVTGSSMKDQRVGLENYIDVFLDLSLEPLQGSCESQAPFSHVTSDPGGSSKQEAISCHMKGPSST